MTKIVAQEALKLICDFEGYLRRLNDGTDRVKPYLCPAGVPTIGLGSTRYFPGGQRVTMSDPPISRARAEECLEGELRTNARAIAQYTTRPLHPLMHGALVSFAYNCGNGAYQASTLRKRVNEGRWDDVPAQFAKWRMGGGRLLTGLVRRRREEAAMFMRGVALLKAGDATWKDTTEAPPPPPAPAATKTEPKAPEHWRVLVRWFFNK